MPGLGLRRFLTWRYHSTHDPSVSKDTSISTGYAAGDDRRQLLLYFVIQTHLNGTSQ